MVGHSEHAVAVGVDLGGSACKVTALDELGRVIADERRAYPTSRPRTGWVEQDPDDWVRAAEAAVRSLTAKLGPQRVRALSVTGATHNAVLLGVDSRPLRPCITLADQRAAPQADRLAGEFGQDILRRCRNWPRAGWTLPQLIWLAENEIETLRRTRRIVFMKDYVRAALTGDFLTDWIDAEGSLLLDVSSRSWDAHLCGLAEIAPISLPQLVAPTDVVGVVSAKAANEFGLHRNTPVVAGCSDTAAEAFASGANQAGAGVIKIATAGNVNVVTASPKPSPAYFTYTHVVSPLSYCSFGTNAAASALSWLGSVLGRSDLVVGAGLDSVLASTPPGADGLLFHPYLAGERAPVFDPTLRASFVGLSARHTRDHLIRAGAEGVALSIADCAEVGASLGLVARDNRLLGGGVSSLAWAQIVADALGRELAIPVLGDASAGAALLALTGAGLLTHANAAELAGRTARTVEPRPAERELYGELLGLYREAREEIAPVVRKLQARAPSETVTGAGEAG